MAITLSGASLTTVHRAFVAELPRLDHIFRFQFRRWPRQRRAEAIAAAWAGLIRRGKDPRAVGPTGIAFNATRSVMAVRTLGHKARRRRMNVSARGKLDQVYVNGCLLIAAVVGLILHSWVSFVVTLAVPFGVCSADGPIRIRGERW